jgi:hypothetical protein
MDQSTNRPIETTVAEIASDALETPVEELPVLFNEVDTDALERLVSPSVSTRSTSVTVVFEYAGLKVTVQSGGTVYATSIDDEDNSIQ